MGAMSDPTSLHSELLDHRAESLQRVLLLLYFALKKSVLDTRFILA
jgi:hypothetical protein